MISEFAYHVCQRARRIQVHQLVLLNPHCPGMMAFILPFAHGSWKVKHLNLCSHVEHVCMHQTVNLITKYEVAHMNS